jgi:hypothetical protein
MSALFDVDLRTAEAADQKIAEPLLRSFQVVRRIHGPEHVVAWNLAIECRGKTFESGLADGGINLLLFHSNRS